MDNKTFSAFKYEMSQKRHILHFLQMNKFGKKKNRIKRYLAQNILGKASQAR